MKKLILSVIAMILLCSMAIGVNAEWDNPYNDVKENQWFYEAVKTTSEKGIFTGVTDDRFDPDGKMTRAMFVTTLARLVGAELVGYTGMPFTDVSAEHWFAPYVQWAYDNEITNGVSPDKFGSEDYVTREQMVTLFYKTAVKYGADYSVTDTFKYDKVYDAEKIGSYAIEAMKWAMQNSIISGTGVNGKEIIVDPWGTATRAQAAQIITKYFAFLDKDLPPVTGLTINGNPIENYTIVYGENNPYVEHARESAEFLKGYIKDATGASLNIETDARGVGGPEILVGVTNREDKGLVTADRDGEDICSFEISVQGDYVLIAGKSDEKRHTGTEFGVYGFAEQILEVEFYSDNVRVYNIVRDKDIPDKYVFKDGPGYEYRVVYWGNLNSKELSTGEPFNRAGKTHNLYKLVGFGEANGDDPCLTDETNLNTIEENFLKMMKPDLEAAWVTQNDNSSGYCKCPDCAIVYRDEGSRNGTLMRLMNRLADAADKAGYPDVEIWTAAYTYSVKPCKSVLDDQIVVFYCPIENCASHPYYEPCKLNKSISDNIVGWDAICKKIYTWDYSTNFKYSSTPMPLTKAFRENKEWFYSHGVRGEFNNALDSRPGEFDALKAYILAELQWDPTMSEETYRSKIADFLDAYYGPGGKYINEYIKLTEELCDENCFSYYTLPSVVIRNDVVIEYNDQMNSLWDAAEAMCENAKQLKNIRRSRLSWTYMYLDAVYESMFTKGTEATKAEYVAMATDFYNELSTFDLRWAESGGGSIAFNPEKSPVDW